QVATERAETLVKMGRLAEARAAFTDILAAEEATHSAFLPTTQSSRAELALAEKAWADAQTWAQRSIADFESKGGPENPALWLPLTRLAESKIGRGDVAGARPLLERALSIGARVEVSPEDLARARDDLAKLGH